jgi:cytochrome c oxidase subunit 3
MKPVALIVIIHVLRLKFVQFVIQIDFIFRDLEKFMSIIIKKNALLMLIMTTLFGYQRHSFQMINPSPWPFVSGIGAFILMSGSVMYFQSVRGGNFVMLFGLLIIVLTMIIWWRDVIREATFEGHHTKIVQKGLRYGMILFIVSEVMFFFAFFWAFFHSSLAPTVEIGSIWPPEQIHPFNPWDVPLLNTIILLSSGATVTWAHHSITNGMRFEAIYSLNWTIFLAILFTILQVFEYLEASFNISDGIYGSTFFMATGFHGFHVIIGTTFLTVCLFRLLKYHFTTTHHFGFEAAAWYWHFVDVVWLFLFVSIYWWGTL